MPAGLVPNPTPLFPKFKGTLLEVGNETSTVRRAAVAPGGATANALMRLENAHQQLESLLRTATSTFSNVLITDATGAVIGFLNASGFSFTIGDVTTTINDQEPTGGGANVGGLGVMSASHGTQTTTGTGFFICLNKNGKATIAMATLDETNAASAGILEVFDGSGTGSFGGGRVLIYDGNALLGQVIGTWKVQNAGGTTFAELTSIGQVSGVDSSGAWGVGSVNGLQLRGVQVIAGNGDGFLRTLSIGSFGVVFNVTGDANVNSLTINSSSFLIANSGDANLNSLSIGGVSRITSGGVVSSSNGFTGSATYIKTVNFGSSTTTSGTVTVVAGIVTSAT